MKRKLARVLIPLAGVALVLGTAATPAQAGANFNVNVGSEYCGLYGYYLQSNESRVRPNGCYYAQARLKYITSGGSTTFAYGGTAWPGWVSVATGGLMVLERAGRGAIVEGGTYWSGYKAYNA